MPDKPPPAVRIEPVDYTREVAAFRIGRVGEEVELRGAVNEAGQPYAHEPKRLVAARPRRAKQRANERIKRSLKVARFGQRLRMRAIRKIGITHF